MKASNNIFPIAIIFIIFLVFCGRDNTAFAMPPLGEKGVKLSVYHYNPKGKTDPFRPFVEKELVIKKKADRAAGSIFPLQRADIDLFNLVGIAGSAGRRVAIVEIKEEVNLRAYPVALGTIIGLNRGKVVEIRKDSIVIEEPVNRNTKRKVNRIVKKLHRNEEEGTP
jgi:type IV pilus assembly protein PilP